MTIDEAKQALQDGHKITHRYFMVSEFIHIVEGDLRDESGHIISWLIFWTYRQSEAFVDGWEIYKQ